MAGLGHHAGLHGPGRLRDSRGQLPRLVQCGHVVHADGQVVAVGAPEIKPYSEGVPVSTKSFAHFVQANDANQLEDVFKRHGARIACMLIEPIMGNCLGIAAEPEYLKAARALCDKYGVVLLIDEVKTGFRVARGGVQELYGMHADLCTFAKALGNGYPISVLAGREHIMRKIGRGVADGGAPTTPHIDVPGRRGAHVADSRRDRRARALGTSSNSNVNVKDNKIKGFPENGIVAEADPAPGPVGTLVFSYIVGNEVRDNGSDGIFIERASVNNHNNELFDNEAEGNHGLDCDDTTAGGGTLGTWDAWFNNSGNSSSPTGLCTPGRGHDRDWR